MNYDGYDNLRLCEICGDAYTTGKLCVSCARQQAIDHADILDAALYDETYYDPMYGYVDEDDWDDFDHGNDFDYEDIGDFYDYPEPTRLQRFRSKIRQLIRAVRYRFDRKFRQSVDEIPF